MWRSRLINWISSSRPAKLSLRAGGHGLHVAIQKVRAADDELERAARGLRGNCHWYFLDEGSAAIGPQQHFHGDGVAGPHFAVFDPRVVDGGPAVLGERLHVQFRLVRSSASRTDSNRFARNRP